MWHYVFLRLDEKCGEVRPDLALRMIPLVPMGETEECAWTDSVGYGKHKPRELDMQEVDI